MIYQRKIGPLEATRWYPDVMLGDFASDGYSNHRLGTDAAGVEYTICDVGLHTDRGFQKIGPGDWIVSGPDARFVISNEMFRILCVMPEE